MFVYDLPYVVRSNLVASLNAGDVWKDLAGACLGYNNLDIQRFYEARYKPATSPADALLTHYGQRNGTVEEIFKHLHTIGLYQSMYILKDQVPTALRSYLQTPTSGANGGNGHVPSPSQHTPYPSSYFDPVRTTQNILPPPLPRTQINAWIGNDLDRPAGYRTEEWEDDKKIINKDLDLPTDHFHVGDPTRDVNLPSFPSSSFHQQPAFQAAASRAVPIAELATNIGGNTNVNASSPSCKSDMSSSWSRLKKRVPSGVPLPPDGVFLQNIPFEELKACCGNFDRNTPGILLGQGGFGEVFKGKFHGQDVAVKLIKEERQLKLGHDAYQKCINQAITELHTLHSYPAENILQLLAISFDPTFKTGPCLVYQFMPNGSVSDRLKKRDGTPPLSWDKRADIALGTARGLMHLHANNIIHGDIKSANILLDKHFDPKIGDFGLARGGPESEQATVTLVSKIQGTQSYLPEDYLRTRQLSGAVDVFCFGIFMFELVSSKSPSFRDSENEPIREFFLESSTPEPWVDNSLPPSHWSQLLFFIGKDCANKFRKKRPEIKIVLDALEKLISQPSPAMALQSYYDAQKMRNTSAESSSRNKSPQPQQKQTKPDWIPTILEEAETASKGEASTDIPIFFAIDEPSLPNLSKYLTYQNNLPLVVNVDQDDFPDFSLLNV